jgi:hypothetical protein
MPITDTRETKEIRKGRRARPVIIYVFMLFVLLERGCICLSARSLSNGEKAYLLAVS